METREAKTRGNFFEMVWNSTATTELLKLKRGKAFCGILLSFSFILIQTAFFVA